jgi:hypothetical protein
LEKSKVSIERRPQTACLPENPVIPNRAKGAVTNLMEADRKKKSASESHPKTRKLKAF